MAKKFGRTKPLECHHHHHPLQRHQLVRNLIETVYIFTISIGNIIYPQK